MTASLDRERGLEALGIAAVPTLMLLVPSGAVQATAAEFTQDISGSIHDVRGLHLKGFAPGEVTPDAPGAAISGATFTLTNLVTGQTLVTQTDDRGAFDLRATPAGRYRLEIAKPTFEGARRVGLALKNPAPAAIGAGAADDPNGPKDRELELLKTPRQSPTQNHSPCWGASGGSYRVLTSLTFEGGIY